MAKQNGSPATRDGGALNCDWCGRSTPSNYVHGHIQCLHCHRNIAPCCEGETCPPDRPAGGHRSADGRRSHRR